MRVYNEILDLTFVHKVKITINRDEFIVSARSRYGNVLGGCRTNTQLIRERLIGIVHYPSHCEVYTSYHLAVISEIGVVTMFRLNYTRGVPLAIHEETVLLKNHETIQLDTAVLIGDQIGQSF